MTRMYRSPRRALQAQQTRAAVLTACRAMFAERGWAATGVRDIAATAGVSVETVYATLGGKVALLTAALDDAGDDEPVPLAERPMFLALGEGSLAERTGAAAALITDIHVRTIGLQRALREGAGGEPALAQLLAAKEENRRASTGRAWRSCCAARSATGSATCSGRRPARRSSTRWSTGRDGAQSSTPHGLRA